MQNQMPGVEQILEMMAQKLGGKENIPEAIIYAKDVAPDIVQQIAISSKQSVSDENSPFDPKTANLIYLAAALAMKDEECIKATLNAALTFGTTKEELLYVVKIVRHAANNGIVGAAAPIFKALSEKEK